MKLWRKDKFKNTARVYFRDFPMSQQSYLSIIFYFAKEGNVPWKLNKLIYKAASKLRIPPSQITDEHLCSFITAAINRSCESKTTQKGPI